MLTTRVALALMLALVLPTSAHAQMPSEERLRFLMAWAADALNLPSRNLDLPRILSVSDRAIQIEFYGLDRVREYESRGVRLTGITAAYRLDERYMIVNAATDFTDPANEYVLVHELAHHVQAEHGKHDAVRCIQELEKDAYRVQNLWVRATGQGVESDPMSVWIFSMCPQDQWR